jgi:hypothetical protein
MQIAKRLDIDKNLSLEVLDKCKRLILICMTINDMVEMQRHRNKAKKGFYHADFFAFFLFYDTPKPQVDGAHPWLDPQSFR